MMQVCCAFSIDQFKIMAILVKQFKYTRLLGQSTSVGITVIEWTDRSRSLSYGIRKLIFAHIVHLAARTILYHTPSKRFSFLFK